MNKVRQKIFFIPIFSTFILFYPFRSHGQSHFFFISGPRINLFCNVFLPHSSQSLSWVGMVGSSIAVLILLSCNFSSEILLFIQTNVSVSFGGRSCSQFGHLSTIFPPIMTRFSLFPHTQIGDAMFKLVF